MKPAQSPAVATHTPTPVICLACSVIESMMHGVAYFTLKGRTLTAHYTDGQKESATAKPETVAHLQMYSAYCNDNGPEVNPPNTFNIVSEVQSARASALVAGVAK